jgi:ubiquinone/menaquinone biosynthesis C-methylase UbiE
MEDREVKTRESGMPDEEMWQTFFSPSETLLTLGLCGKMSEVAEFGCGYGTFTIPAAQIINGTVHAFDIDANMISSTRAKAQQYNLSNVRLSQRDFVSDGTGLPDTSVDYVMLFNILHAEAPDILLTEAFRILRNEGKLAIMHWNYDSTTPRGPSMDIRPQPQHCVAWATNAGFVILQQSIDLPPYHYGIIAKKGERK